MPSLSAAASRCWRSYLIARTRADITDRARPHLLSSLTGQTTRIGARDLNRKGSSSCCSRPGLYQSRLLLGPRHGKSLCPLQDEDSAYSFSKQSVEGRFAASGLGPALRSSLVRGSRAYTTAMPTDAQIKDEALSILKQAKVLPSLVVFDLDYTIWPFWCEVKTTKSQPRLYPEVRGIIEALKEAHVPLAVASRTPSPNIANVFLSKLQLTSYFAQQEIYPTLTHKTEHFKALVQGTKVPYEEMLFFDDEDRNVNTISPLGVKCVLVEDGVNLNALREGVAKFQSSKYK